MTRAEPSTEDLYAAVNTGLALYRAGRYFDAHEAWEWAWQRSHGARRLALQGLIQLAAALVKRERGNPTAVSNLLAKATDKLERAALQAPSILGLDLDALSAQLRAFAGDEHGESDGAHLRGNAAGDAGQAATQTTPARAAPLLPESTGPDGFVYLHGFASGPGSSKAGRIVPALRERGYSVALPDLNDGDFRGLTVSRALNQAQRLLRDRTIVIGSSLGGYLAALLARADDRVRALVLMAPAFDLADRLENRHGPDAIARWRETGSIAVEHYAYGGLRELEIGFLDDARRQQPRPPLEIPTYILQGIHDDVVPAAMVREVAASSGHVELDLVDDDHGLVASSDRATRRALAFADELSFAPDPAPTFSPD